MPARKMHKIAKLQEQEQQSASLTHIILGMDQILCIAFSTILTNAWSSKEA